MTTINKNLEISEKYTVENNTFLATPKDNPKDKIEIEIGDSKQVDFLPQVKIQRWDNEVNFSARLIHDEKSPVVSTEADKIVWKGDKVEANLYDLTEDEGGYEFEVILKEKPDTNIVSFTIQTKGLDFFYQPELTQEEKDQGAERPENVIGSYAVYASENKVNYVGGKEYKCGKVGHIFRPRIEDANGDWIWGELNVDTQKGILSVTIPQDFLDKAVYPVRHAAGLTFGYTTAGASSANEHTYLDGTEFVTGATGTIQSFSAYAIDTASGNLQVGLYDTASPSNLVCHTGDVAVTTSAGWRTGSASGSIINATYSIEHFESNTSGKVYYDSGFPERYTGSQTYGTWPATVTFSRTPSGIKWSLYATYTAGGGSAPTVTTQAVSSITDTTATGNGNVTADGGASVTERGVCWATTTGTESTAGSHANNGTGTGAYTVSMTGLSASTLYYVKAYAINSVGTSYGSEVSFTTNASGGVTNGGFRSLLGVGK